MVAAPPRRPPRSHRHQAAEVHGKTASDSVQPSEQVDREALAEAAAADKENEDRTDRFRVALPSRKRCSSEWSVRV